MVDDSESFTHSRRRGSINSINFISSIKVYKRRDLGTEIATPITAARGGVMGKVAWGFTCSIDGFIAGPGHDMSWLSASEPNAEGATEDTASKVAVIISGRRGYDAAKVQAD